MLLFALARVLGPPAILWAFRATVIGTIHTAGLAAMLAGAVLVLGALGCAAIPRLIARLRNRQPAPVAASARAMSDAATAVLRSRPARR